MFQRLRSEFGVIDSPPPKATPTVSVTSRARAPSGRRSGSRTAQIEPSPIQPKSTNISPNTTTKIKSPNPTKVGPGDGEILIAVMGVTGSGKSHFCRSATRDDDIKVGDGLESCSATDSPVKYKCLLIFRYTKTSHAPTDVTYRRWRETHYTH
jgi:hypothetical protein